jgi:hypothetical protein
MATIIKLSEEQTTRFDEFIALQQAIKDLKIQSDIIRTEIDQCVRDAEPPDTDAVVILVNDNIIEFSVVAKSFTFSYDIEQYIIETSAYNTLTVSSTAAKTELSSAQVEKYFSVEKGTRRIKIK